jgi:Ca2+-binding RTX toxin-like protein
VGPRPRHQRLRDTLDIIARRSIARLALVGLIAAALLLPAPTPAAASFVQLQAGTVALTDALGEVNHVSVTRDGDFYVLTDAVSPVIALPGCEQLDPNRVRCAAAGVAQIGLALGDGADRAAIADDAYPPVPPPGDLPVRVFAGAGDDELQGGAGADSFFGDAGADVIATAGGDDALVGGDAAQGDQADVLDGGPGAERVISGGAGNDRILAGDGDDRAVAGGPGDDTIDGEDGADVLFGDVGDDVLRGGRGDDVVDVGAAVDPALALGRDALDGGAGDDTLGAGPPGQVERDTLGGGDGFDTARYDARVAPVTVTLDGVADDGEGGEGDNVLPDVERVLGGSDADTLVGGPRADVLDGGPSDDLILGLAGADTLTGGVNDGGSDTISGGQGPDVVRGGAGDDALDGGEGDDDVAGGGGSDALAGAGDQDALAGGPGIDSLEGGDGDDLLRGGDLVLVGADGADELAGDAGDDTLLGGAGGDRLDGGAGADRMNGEDGRDTVSYELRSAPVMVTFDGKANDGEAGEGDNVASDIEIVLGGTLTDTLSGDERTNALTGGAGEDLIEGGAGTDTLGGGSAADVLRARDGTPDAVTCGQGSDLAIVDPVDSVRGCETADRGGEAPALRRTAVVRATRGRVAFRLPGAARFVDLQERVGLPMRAALDARAGRVALATAAGPRRGQAQAATFWDGAFTVRQTRKRARRPITELRLRGGDFGVCAGAATPGRARASSRLTTVRRLWGKGRGRYRTRGRYSSGVVRGTMWLTEDRCDGTLTRVMRGTVVVRDFGLGRTVVVHAGEQYLARARPAARRGD